MCELGENSPPFVSMPLTAMTAAVDFLSGEKISGGLELSSPALSEDCVTAVVSSTSLSPMVQRRQRDAELQTMICFDICGKIER